jgi:hypothetical protein
LDLSVVGSFCAIATLAQQTQDAAITSTAFIIVAALIHLPVAAQV